jgi:tetratricopeptide (TPR) repeat protein
VALVCAFASGCGAESPSSLLSRAQLEIERGHEDKGLALLNNAIARKPDFGKALGERGAIYAKRKQNQLAMKDLSMAIHFLPENEAIVYHCQRALVCRFQGESHAATASKDCDVIIEHHTTEDIFRATAFSIRAWTNSIANRHEAAFQDSSAALSNPKADDWVKVEALSCRAHAFLDSGDYKRAIADCTEAIRINPSHSELPYLLRGIAYMSSGHQDEAAKDMRTVEQMKAAR